jgi:mutator protein MutT
VLFEPGLRARIARNLAAIRPRLLPDGELRRAAVNVTLVADAGGEACFLLQRRAADLRGHAGQWALPGGRVDPGETPEQAARRELLEEVCLVCGEADLIGRLDDYPTRSGYVISPFVVWLEDAAALKADPGEVAAVYRVPLAELLRPDSPRFSRIAESDRPVIGLPIWDMLVHAPTAAYLYQFREAALLGRHTPVADLEQPLFAWR